MKRIAIGLLIPILALSACGDGHADSEFEEMLDGLLKGSAPAIRARQLLEREDGVVLLDARPKEEFDVAHLKDARRVGFDDFDPASVKDLPKDKPVVVYCSVGYRSEKIGEKLKALGFTNVSNLRGGIFDWYNLGLPVFNAEGETDRVHPYDKKWGRWVKERN